MTARVSPTERIRADIDDLFDPENRGDLGDVLEEVARLGARLLLQAALEAEVTEFLGRNRYERRQLAKEARAGSRTGTAISRSRRPPGRSPSSARSSGARPRRSPPRPTPGRTSGATR